MRRLASPASKSGNPITGLASLAAALAKEGKSSDPLKPMPIVVVCGLPSSGKTCRALEIRRFLQARHPELKCRVVSEETLLLRRKDAYRDSRQEKDTRGLIKSEVERFASPSTLVIVDSVNYIKGFRYELYCISKNSRTTHVVVFVDTPLALCKEFHQAASAADTEGVLDKFALQSLDDMAFRFEKPQARNRWDKPLVVVQPVDALDMDSEDWLQEQQRSRAEITGEFTLARGKGMAAEKAREAADDAQGPVDVAGSLQGGPVGMEPNQGSLAQSLLREQRRAVGGDSAEMDDLVVVGAAAADEAVGEVGLLAKEEAFLYMPRSALQEVEQALFGTAAYKPNTATKPNRIESTNFVHELDRVTQQVIAAVLDAQNTYGIGTEITVPGSSVKLRLGRKVSLAEFRRLRRQFLKITELNSVPEARIADAFVTYLSSSL